MKRLIIFDLDGTLAESKASLDAEMATLLARLLEVVKVAVISGGAWAQFEKQVLSYLPQDERLKDLSLLPTCGTKFYRYDGAWQKLYSEDFSAEEKERIISALNKAIDQSGFRAVKHWGDLIEDRGSQITFSALGQEAPLDEKKKWDSDFKKREKIKEILKPLISDIFHSIGRLDVDRCHQAGHRQGLWRQKAPARYLASPFEDMIFVGDAIFPGGNDYPAKQAGVVSIEVRDPHETKRVIEATIACLESGDGRCRTSS